MAIKSLKQMLLAKVESVYGTDPLPTGALNAMLVGNVKVNPLNATEIERKVLMPNFANFGKVIADVHATLDFDVEFSSSGLLGVPPAYGVLFKGCARAETIVAGTSVTYAPIDSQEQSLTFYLNIDGKQRIFKGAKGNVKAKLTPKGDPLLSFSFIGLYGPATDTPISASVLTAWKAPTGVSPQTTSASLHGLTANIADFSFDFGNKMVYRPLINSETVQFTDRATTGSITIEETSVATKDWDSVLRTGAVGGFTLLHGTVVGSKIYIQCPAVQLHGMSSSEADNIEMLQFNMAMQSSAGNDELTIAYL